MYIYVYIYINIPDVYIPCAWTQTQNLQRQALEAGLGGWPLSLPEAKSSNILLKKGETMGKRWGNHGCENKSFEMFATVNFFHIV